MTKKKNPEDLLPVGRKSIYTEELAKRICDAIACTHYSIQRLCKETEGFPNQDTIFAWKNTRPEFSDLYEQAMTKRADVMAIATLEIADNVETHIDKDGIERVDGGVLRKANLRIGTRQWLAERLNQKKWNLKLKELEEEKKITDSQRSEILELRAQLDGKNKKDY